VLHDSRSHFSVHRLTYPWHQISIAWRSESLNQSFNEFVHRIPKTKRKLERDVFEQSSSQRRIDRIILPVLRCMTHDKVTNNHVVIQLPQR